MKYEVILHNDQGAVFSDEFDTQKECQNYLDSFADPENLTGGVREEHGITVAIKKIKRFDWS